MTMQRNDYLRIASVLRRTREQFLAKESDEEFRDFTQEVFDDVALNLGQAFLGVNERFKLQQFLVNSLGDRNAEQVFEQHLKEYGAR